MADVRPLRLMELMRASSASRSDFACALGWVRFQRETGTRREKGALRRGFDLLENAKRAWRDGAGS